MTPKYSFVIPVYNEEKTILELYRQLVSDGAAGWIGRIILVNDGGRDRSLQLLHNLHQKTRVFAISALLAISVIKSL